MKVGKLYRLSDSSFRVPLYELAADDPSLALFSYKTLETKDVFMCLTPPTDSPPYRFKILLQDKVMYAVGIKSEWAKEEFQQVGNDLDV